MAADLLHVHVEYLRRITDGLVTAARIRQYVESSPKMLEFLEGISPWLVFVWKPGYADYYPELPGGSELGSTINVPPIDLRKLGDDEQKLLKPLALAPRGIWLGPRELRSFYRIRQSWAGKAVLLKLISRMVRARVFNERIAAIGQSLAARLRLAMKDRGIPLWLDSPMAELITDADGAVTGASVDRNGRKLRIGARHGVILAAGGFDHDLAWRKEHQPVVDQDWSFGNPAAMGDGIRAGQKVGAATDLLDEAWWFPAIQWPDGRMQFMLNERMMPAQFIVNGDGKRFINEAAPYMDFGHAMIDGQKSGVTHIPCWLITDHLCDACAEHFAGVRAFLDARALLAHIPPLEYPGQALACALYLEGGIRGCEIGTEAVRDDRLHRLHRRVRCLLRILRRPARLSGLGRQCGQHHQSPPTHSRHRSLHQRQRGDRLQLRRYAARQRQSVRHLRTV